MVEDMLCHVMSKVGEDKSTRGVGGVGVRGPDL